MLFIAFLITFIITALSTPLAIKFAKKYGLVDNPKTRPHPAHVQNRIVPRAGGISIYVGIVSGILIFLPFSFTNLALIFSLTLLLITGLIDDKIDNFSPYLRILLQFFAAFIVIQSGLNVAYVSNPFGGIIYLTSLTPLFTFIPQLIAAIWIVTIMNVVNWSKGVDGQMPGIILVAASIIAIIAYRFYLQGDVSQLQPATLSLIIAGTSLGFLLYNWHPAKIFPGFSASTILGFMIAYLSILSSAKIAAALLILLIPFTDAVYTGLRRILSGKSPVWADRHHLHHKLLALGWSHPKIATFYIITCLLFGLPSIWLSSHSKLIFLSIFGVLAFATLTILHIILTKPKT